MSNAAEGTRRPFDLTLYLVAGPADVGPRPLEEVVAAAVEGGVTLVQLRDKTLPDAALIERARRLVELLTPRGVPLIVNDRVTVAAEAGAAGVHLGPDDSDVAQARARLGPAAIIGVSAGTPEEAARVDARIADYAGVGSVYPTTSKADAGAAIGLDGLTGLSRRLPLPVVAIGGISIDSARAVAACPVQGLAVVSAICGAADPKAAAQRLRAAIEAGRADVRDGAYVLR